MPLKIQNHTHLDNNNAETNDQNKEVIFCIFEFVEIITLNLHDSLKQ